MTNDPRSLVITGASSGIGEGLALAYAAPGVHLTLTGRDRARLMDIARRCEHAGATVTARLVDVTEQTAMADLINEIDAVHPLDLVIANAGISGGSGGGGEDEAQARAIFEVNFNGVLNTIWPAITVMKARRRGHIALISSIAGLTPMPGAPAYSASKIAVKAYGEALNGALKPFGITVSTILPGFVTSRITAKNDFPMPLLMTPERAAQRIRRGLERGRISIVFPKRLAAIPWLIGLLPPRWRIWILSHAPKKS